MMGMTAMRRRHLGALAFGAAILALTTIAGAFAARFAGTPPTVIVPTPQTLALPDVFRGHERILGGETIPAPLASSARQGPRRRPNPIQPHLITVAPDGTPSDAFGFVQAARRDEPLRPGRKLLSADEQRRGILIVRGEALSFQPLR